MIRNSVVKPVDGAVVENSVVALIFLVLVLLVIARTQERGVLAPLVQAAITPITTQDLVEYQIHTNTRYKTVEQGESSNFCTPTSDYKYFIVQKKAE